MNWNEPAYRWWYKLPLDFKSISTNIIKFQNIVSKSAIFWKLCTLKHVIRRVISSVSVSQLKSLWQCLLKTSATEGITSGVSRQYHLYMWSIHQLLYFDQNSHPCTLWGGLCGLGNPFHSLHFFLLYLAVGECTTVILAECYIFILYIFMLYFVIFLLSQPNIDCWIVENKQPFCLARTKPTYGKLLWLEILSKAFWVKIWSCQVCFRLTFWWNPPPSQYSTL